MRFACESHSLNLEDPVTALALTCMGIVLVLAGFLIGRLWEAALARGREEELLAQIGRDPTKPCRLCIRAALTNLAHPLAEQNGSIRG